MSDQALNALTAVALGGVVAVVLFIPVAAYEYRRDGRLGAGDLTTLIVSTDQPEVLPLLADCLLE